MELNNIAADPAKMKDGAWWDFEQGALCPGGTPHETNACMKLAFAGVEYFRALEEERKPFLQEIRANRLSEENEAMIAGKAIGRAVIKDFVNFSLGGEPFTYSDTNAITLMTEPRFAFIRTFVMSAMNNEQGYMEVELEDAKGN